MCVSNLFVLTVLILSNLFLVTPFNLDTLNFALYDSDPFSMFGFSVGIHKEHNTGWILVGAPEAQSTHQNLDVYRGGAVFKCPVDRDGSCQEIPFDRRGNTFFKPDESIQGKIYDNKSGQWFGATLATSGSDNGPVVACAPRYVWFSKDMNRRDPVGTCYVSDGSFSQFEEYSPCRTSNWGYHRQGLCQAGFSAAINPEGDRLFMGAPGSYYWQGQMYSIDAHARFNFTPGLYRQMFGAQGSVHQQSLETRPAVFSTKEGRAKDDDSYMGYSTIVGNFMESGDPGIAVGMPRGAELRGKVLLFTWDLINKKNFSSDQIGSYFGYSLAAVDVDGDKKEDLIIGSPMYTVPNNEGKYDVGRVYVIYHNSKNGMFKSSYTIDGFNSRSRFGHALASLGDINQDGYGDFAVGAPYDGMNQQGAVYIYHGSSKGVREKYSQVIYAEAIVSPTQQLITTFGFSLSGGMDLDGNEYPDMAVGAYLSSQAFFFRSRPVIRVEAVVRFLTVNKQIDLKHADCRLRNGQYATCTDIDFCVQYRGKGIPQYINLQLQYILDTKKSKTPRMLFLEHDSNTFNETITLVKDTPETCRKKRVYVKTEIRDKLTPLEAEVNYSMLDEEDASSVYHIRNPRSILKPVIDLNSPPSRKDSIVIQKNCGNDNICVPNLQINYTSNVEKYLLGSNLNLEFDIIVSNFGEDSFETTFQMQYPEGIYYKKIETKPNTNILCSPSENRTIKCDIGNPLPAGKIATFKILLQPYHKEGMAASYEFDLFVNSTNPEDMSTLSDNHRHISIDIWVDSSLELSGKSFPSEVHFNAMNYLAEGSGKESEIGPQVAHVYYLRNTGPAKIQEAEMFILWPYETTGGEDFLYLLDQPHTLGNVKCDVAPANYKNYKLDYNSKSIWERLQIDTSESETSTESHAEGIIVESGGGTVGVEGGGLSKTEGKLDEEIGSSGDASLVHERRHNATATQTRYNGTTEGRTISVESKWETKIVNGVPVTKMVNITTIRDLNGNILNQDRTTDSFSLPSYGTGRVYASGSRGGGQHGGSFSTAQGGYNRGSTESYNRTFIGQQTGGQRNYTSYKPNIIYTSSGNTNYRTNGLDRTETQPDYSVSGVTKVVEEKYPGQVHDTAKHGVFVWNRQQSNGNDFDTAASQSRNNYNNEHLYAGKNNFQSSQKNYVSGNYHTNQENYGSNRTHGSDYYAKQGSHSSRTNQEIYGSGRTHFAEPNYGNDNLQTSQTRGSDYYSKQDSQNVNVQQGGNINSIEEEYDNEQTLTGYIDEQGVYHSISSSQNKTLTSDSDRNKVPNDLAGAALGSGFRVTTLELGNLNPSSEISGTSSGNARYGLGLHTSSEHSGRSNNYAGGSESHSRDASGSRQYSRESSGSSTGSRSYSRGSQGSSGGSRQQWYDEKYHSQRGSLPPSESEVLGRDNVPTDRPNLDNRYIGIGRRKRQAVETAYSEIESLFQCTLTKCFYVRCVVGMLEKDKEVSVLLRSRLNVRTVQNISSTQPVKLSSMMVARISKLPYIGTPRKQNLHSHEIFTYIPGPEPELKPDVGPLWIVVLSAVAGTVILLLIITILYKLGFFKRKRPSNAPERQPLNRNGYHQGDEAL